MSTFAARPLAALTAALGTLAFAASAGAATLTVDDDQVQCPTAAYTTIQAAVDAAATGDTVSVCPGTYVEGTGDVASNALTISKSIAIRGVGADLVTIKPRLLSAGSSIAAGTPSLRDDTVGNIVAVVGTPDAPIDVDISGVTVDGGGVASEAGILFLDAGGAVDQARVTRVSTSEQATAYTGVPGGYRSWSFGYGIAQVTRATPAAPAADTSVRELSILGTRIDKYNAAGVLSSGATGDTAPYTGTNVTNRVSIDYSQIVGRTQCVNYELNGTCGSSQVALLTTNTLFGQDGVRVVGGASTEITGSLVSQNLVNGAGAPTRSTIAANGNVTNQTANNANLRLGSGVRLVDAGASSIDASNIVDNAYGVQNVEADDATARTSTPVAAENNWWGLNYYRGGATGSGQAVNPGPAISPTANPPIPENPVNGASVPDGTGSTSTAVDFFPFRNGPQSDPNSGEFIIADAPFVAYDAAPSVSVPNVSVKAGGTATITALASDDIALKSVTLFEGSEELVSGATSPLSTTVSIPADAACPSTRTYTATATDWVGQTTSANGTLSIACADPKPDPIPDPPVEPAKPTLDWATRGDVVATGGTEFGVSPVAAAGIAKVEFLLGTRVVCTVTSAPFSCVVKPTGAETGKQSLRVVVTDARGNTAEVIRAVTVNRFAATLSLKAKSKTLKGKKKVKKTISGTLKLPSGVTKAQGCVSGSVTVVVKSGSKTITNSQVKLSKSCTFKKSVTIAKPKKKTTYTASAKFGGNAVLLKAQSDRRFS